MIAVDTNLLIYAHRRDSSFHERARDRVRTLAEGRERWAIPWPCLYEFFAIVTHPRVYKPPTSSEAAIAQIEAWLRSPTVVLLSEADDHWSAVSRQIVGGRVIGPRVHDARIAALCVAHGVREIWTADRDFGRFSDVAARNPLVA